MTYIVTNRIYVDTWDAGVEYHPGDVIPMGAHKGWKILCAVPLDAFREDFVNAIRGELYRFQWNMDIRAIPDDLRDEIGDAMDEFCDVLTRVLARWYSACRYLEK